MPPQPGKCQAALRMARIFLTPRGGKTPMSPNRRGPRPTRAPRRPVHRLGCMHTFSGPQAPAALAPPLHNDENRMRIFIHSRNDPKSAQFMRQAGPTANPPRPKAHDRGDADHGRARHGCDHHNRS